MTRCVVFDLDGTLVDSVPDLAACLNRLMAVRGLAPFTELETQAMVGDGAKVLLERAFAARRSALDADGLAWFLTDYTAHAAVLTRPYPGVVDTLTALKAAGFVLAVCTNKPEIPARALLDALDLSRFFAAVGGGDSYPVRKPDPAHLLAVIEAADATPQRSVMVGDHHNDIHAAQRAGVRSIWARWGYGTDVTGADAEADTVDTIMGLAIQTGYITNDCQHDQGCTDYV